MVKNYLIVAIRNLMRNKIYATLNVLGLGIGMACCLLIALFVQHELRYDRGHKNGDRIYQVVRETQGKDGSRGFDWGTSGPLGPALERDFPEVQAAVRLWHWNVKVKREDRLIRTRFSLVDKHVFDVFDAEFVHGNPQTAFADPFGMVITDRVASLLFGEEDPMGRVLTVDNSIFGGDYIIRGVVRAQTAPSTIRFGLIMARMPKNRWESKWITWQKFQAWRPVHTYVLLQKGAHSASLSRKLPDFMTRYMGEEVQMHNAYHLQPFHRVYLHSRADYGIDRFGDIDQLYVLGIVAVFILAIACVNFMNLATAQSIGRAREVGLRKVVGATRWQLIQQFLGESLIVALLALVLALVLCALLLPVFGDLIQQPLSLDREASLTLLPVAVGVILATGILAGSYPAFALSAWQPIETLKHQIRSGNRGAWFWKALVVFQFSISIFLLVGTLVVRDQISYMLNRDLGFETDHLVMLQIFAPSREEHANFEQRLAARYATVKQSFLRHPNVLQATASRYLPFPQGGGGRIWTVRPEGLPGDDWRVLFNEVDEDFLTTMGIELVAGRNFTPGKGRALQRFSSEFLINESAAKGFGWENPIGKQLEWTGLGSGTVVGVFKDYHFAPLREKIAPLALVKWSRLYAYLALKVTGEHFEETMAFLQTQWEKFVPDEPFRPIFIDEGLASAYRNELRLRKVADLSSLLAIFVCCLGLFGLAALSAQRRTKEIGVRKVLGASFGQIALMFSAEFIQLVALASLIAWPVAYYALNNYLSNFSYRIDLGVAAFATSTALAMGIALFTVSYQAWKAAHTNPVDALKYE